MLKNVAFSSCTYSGRLFSTVITMLSISLFEVYG